MTNLYVDPKTFNETCRVYLRPSANRVTLGQYREQAQEIRLRQVVATEPTYVLCKFCGSKDVVKDGVRSGVQYYWCKACQRKSQVTKPYRGCEYRPTG